MVAATTTTIRRQQLETTSSSSASASSLLSSSLSPCCCDECGRVKDDMKNVRADLRFLTHQVSQLMQIFAIKYCQCQDCAHRVCGLDKFTKRDGASPLLFGNKEHTDRDHRHGEERSSASSDSGSCRAIEEGQPSAEDDAKSIIDHHEVKAEPADLMDFQRRKRGHPGSVINLDQLLPKLLAKSSSAEAAVEAVKSASTTGGSPSRSRDEAEEQKLAKDTSAAFYSDCPPPLTKVRKHDFARTAYNVMEKRRTTNIEQSCFMTNRLSSSLGVTGVELPKNCVDSPDMHVGNGIVNPVGLLPTVPSTIFLRSGDERRYAKAFTSTLPTVTGPGLPLVSYGPKSSTFFCGVCKREFSNVYYKRHMVVHANARPHVCDVCGKRFNERSNMMKHRQRLHVP